MEKDERIVGMKEYHTKNKVHFELEVESELLEKHPEDL